VACHNGPAVGGNSFQKMGVVEDYKASSPAEGRSCRHRQGCRPLQLQGADPAQRRMTYPYFHDGAANTLTEAVDVMGRLQLGKKFTAGRKRQDRGLPEDPDRRPAEASRCRSCRRPATPRRRPNPFIK
jgi:cytochrome c peroxidase